MTIELKKNKTLIVNGPAVLSLMEGQASVLGALLPLKQKFKVRDGRALPVYCETDSRFQVILGGRSSTAEFEGNTIPEEWNAASQTILKTTERGGINTIVIGGIDVGKTTFTVFLVNKALAKNLKVNVVDADIGQSDIGPPGTIGIYSPKNYIYDLFYEEPDSLLFIGSVSPSGVQSKMLDAISATCHESKGRFNLTILNTDGWIEGEEAGNYKLNMVKNAEADFIVTIYSSNEMDSLLGKIKEQGWCVLQLKSSFSIRKRNREERRKLRWQAYQRYMRNSSLRVVSLNSVRISGLDSYQKGVLAGLYEAPKKFSGLGVIDELHLEKGLLKIFTPVRQPFNEIEIGQTVVDIDIKMKNTSKVY